MTCQFERELLELGVLQADVLRLALDVLQHLLRERGDRLGRQTLKVFILEVAQVLHGHPSCKPGCFASLGVALSTRARCCEPIAA